MIFYSPTPLDLLTNTSNEQNIVNIQLGSGAYVKAEPLAYNKIRVLDLFSTDPMDYLDDRLQPGSIITLKVGL